MSRIPPDDSAQLPFEQVPGGATMSGLFRIMAHRPAIAQQAMQLLQTTMREGSVDPKLKELLAIRVSQVNNCFY